MARNLGIFFICVLTLAFSACSRDDKTELFPGGIITRVHGTINSRYGEPISNVMIRVGEYKESGGAAFPYSGFGSSTTDFIQYANTVYTDAAGNYDFVFATSGKGNFYQLLVGDSFDSLPENQQFSLGYGVPITAIANDKRYIGNVFEHNSNIMVKLYPCQVTLQFNPGVTSFPFEPYHEYTYRLNLQKVTSDAQTVRTIFIDKFTDQQFILGRTKANGQPQRAVYVFPASQVETPTTQTVIVNESDFIDI